MIEDLKFSLYSVLKNEDAIPFMGDSMIVVADGLGGSGSAIHEIDKTKFQDLKDEIMKSSFYDFEKDKLDDLQSYLDDLLVPMLDEKNDTSALWGSRIAIARFIYALLKNENFNNADLLNDSIRLELVDYINKGLIKTMEHFDLQKGKYENQLILPTTLAALRYKKINEEYFVEAVWAGDSRCYCLTKQGLKQLSVDDEDLSGAVTNLFSADKNNSYLNYKSYKFSEACILIVVSDGFFDPFDPHDNFGFECTLLDCINKCQSTEELKQMLYEIYTSYHADDATMAFVPLGLENYNDIKSLLEERIKYINEMYQKFKTNKEYMSLCNESDLCSYVKTRIYDKFESIANSIIDCLVKHKSDILVTDYMLEIYDKCNKSNETFRNRIKEEHYRKLSLKLKETLCEYKEFPFILETKGVNKRLKSAHQFFEKNKALKLEITKMENEIKRLMELKFQIQKDIKNNEKELYQLIEVVESQSNLNTDAMWTYIISVSQTLLKIHSGLAMNKKVEINAPNLPQIIKFELLLKIQNDLKNINYKLEEYNRIFDLQDSLRTTKGYFQKNEKNMNYELRKVSIKKSQIDYGKIGCEPLNINYVNQQLKENEFQNLKEYFYAHQEEIVLDILKNLSLYYKHTSLIDEYFNKTKLGKFRLYYSLMDQVKDSLDQFAEELELLEKSYTI